MSESIIVTLQLSLKPEAVEPFCAQIPVTLEDTRKFPGFIAITIRRHVDQPNRVIFVEEWQSQEAYAAYVAFRTESGMMDAMADIITEPPQVDIWHQKIA